MRTPFFLALLVPGLALAVPQTVSHQGRLLAADGSALDGPHDLTFKLYDGASDGTVLWEESQSAVAFTNGYFAVTLGATTALPEGALTAASPHLAISVDGEELPGRVAVGSVPFALRAGAVAGGPVDATSLSIGGVQVIGADGKIAWEAISGAPADEDTLAGLGCEADQVPQFDGSDWGCADLPEGASDASLITTGTLDVARLPVGSGAGQVAAGDHTHDAAAITSGTLDAARIPGLDAAKITSGKLAIATLPVGTTGTDVAVGNHSHTAAQVGAIPASGGDVSGSLKLTGSLTVGASTATCNTSLAGTLRWTGTLIEVCTGSAWSPLAQAAPGSSAGFPADSCKAIKTLTPSAASGSYWVKAANGSARQVYCDQTADGGGWTLAVNIQSDLGAINLYTYNNPTTNFTTANYGVNLSEMGVSTSTEYRMSCIESSDNATRKMFIKGLNPTEPIFQAAGTITKTGLVCANNADFNSPLTGANCILGSFDDNLHTYYGSATWDMNWALFAGGSAYTLRHCRNTGGGYHNKGALWYR